MTDDRTFQPDHEHPDPESMTRSELIRAAADGEVPMDRIGGDDLARVEFERSLRAAVNRVSGEAAAPDELRASIQRMFTEHSEPAIVEPIGGGDTRSPSFWNRSARWLGVAAVLALCATVIVMSSRSGGSPFGGHQGAIQAASFIKREADSCTEINNHFNAKFRARSMEEARDLALSIFAKTPDAMLRADDALTSLGYRFAGFGKCAVPGPGRSGHLIYHYTSSPADALSLFIQEDPESMNIDSDHCYRFPVVDTTDNRVVAWRENGFIYYLYSHNAEAIAAARTIFHAPQREITLR